MTDIIGKGTSRGAELKRRAEQIKGLEKTRATMAADLKELKQQIADEYKNAESDGYDKPTLKQVVKELCLDDAERAKLYQAEEDGQMQLDLYRHALGLAETEPGKDADQLAAAEALDAHFGGEGTIADGLRKGQRLVRALRRKKVGHENDAEVREAAREFRETM